MRHGKVLSVPWNHFRSNRKWKYDGNRKNELAAIDFPLHAWTPCNTAMPRPTARTTPNRSSDGWCTVSHVRRKVPIVYNGAVQIRPQKYPVPWTHCQTPIPALSMDPPDLWCQTAARCDLPFFHNALDRRTDRPTDRSRESLMTIGRCAPRATRPNKNWYTQPAYDALNYNIMRHT